jgi:hypothetical protein
MCGSKVQKHGVVAGKVLSEKNKIEINDKTVSIVESPHGTQNPEPEPRTQNMSIFSWSLDGQYER